jgi:serine/threonine protein phosphatase PrpC
MSQEFDKHEKIVHDFLQSMFDPKGVFAHQANKATKAAFDNFFAQPHLISMTKVFLRQVHQEWERYLLPLVQKSARPNNPTPTPSHSPRPGAVPVNIPPQQPMLPKVTFTLGCNGNVGKEFCTTITAPSDVEILSIAVPEGIGVIYDVDTKEIKGTPTKSGEHSIKIGYRFKDLFSDRPALDGACTLVVNPDPQSLWLDKPSDTNDPDWKPDSDKLLMHGAAERSMVGASKRGRSHAHVGSFRDDDFALESFGDWNILAVADGAGSAKRSRKGSHLAVKAAITTIKEKLEGEAGEELSDASATMEQNPTSGNTPAYAILGAAAFSAMKAIEQEAKTQDAAIKEYSTTLIVAIHKHTGFGELVASFWVGDGGVAVYFRKAQLLKVLGEADSGEYAGQTRFLDTALVSDNKEIMSRIRVELVPAFDALVLMTDGVSDPKFETDHNLASIQYWDKLFDELDPILEKEQPESALLDWLDFWSPGNHDDRTIALLW